MIPSIFDAKVQSIDDLGQAEKADWSHRMSGALIAIVGAIGTLGGVGINVVLRGVVPIACEVGDDGVLGPWASTWCAP